MKRFCLIFLLFSTFFLYSCGKKTPIITVNRDFSTEYSVFSEEPNWSDAVIVTGGKDKDIDVQTPNIDTANVDMNNVGHFYVNYEIRDKVGNVTKLSLKIDIVDKEKPVIKGLTNKTIEVGSSLPDLLEGLSVEDNYYDEIMTSAIQIDQSLVDVNGLGIYDVIFTVTDGSGNKANNTIQIHVVDTTRPEFQNLIDKTIQAGLEHAWTQGIVVTDNYDTIQLSNRNVDISQLNINKLGTYPVTYTVSDFSGNSQTKTIQVTVIDTTKPNIIVPYEMGTKIGETIDYLSHLTIIDNLDGVIETAIVDDSQVNLNVVGKYPVTFTVSDKLGNTAVTSIELEVYIPVNTDFLSSYSGYRIDFSTAIELTKPVLTGHTVPTNKVHLYKIWIEDPTLINIKYAANMNYYLYVEKYEDYFVKICDDWLEADIFAGLENRYLYIVLASNFDIDYSINISMTKIDKKEEILSIEEPKLHNALIDTLNLVDLRLNNTIAKKVTTLVLNKKELTTLSGLEIFSNLKYLNLRNNHITDITPILTLYQMNALKDGALDIIGNPLSIEAQQDLFPLFSHLFSLRIDITPNFSLYEVVESGETPSGIIDNIRQRDVYKIENTQSKIISIYLSSSTFDYINLNFELYHYANNEFIKIANMNGTVDDMTRTAIIVSEYDDIYVVVKSDRTANYELHVDVENLDTFSPQVILNTYTNTLLKPKVYGESNIKITEQVLSNVERWYQSDTSENLNDISYLTQVEYLKLINCQLKDLSILTPLTQIKYLDLSANGLSDISFLKIHYDEGKFSHLEKVVLLDNPITAADETVIYLRSMGIEVEIPS